MKLILKILTPIFVVSLFCGVNSHVTVDEYTAETYPDSELDWEQCGLAKPGLVCDPNNVLSDVENGSKFFLRFS